jgi:phospholipid transport system substrate-binding protein
MLALPVIRYPALRMFSHRAARVAVWLLIAALATSARAEPVAPATSAAAVIERFHAALLDVMKNAETLGMDGRRERLTPVMDETYDFPGMAQRSLGAGWAKLDEAQRARFREVFRSLILRTYATRFNGYRSERFEMLGTEPSIAGTEIVRTVLHATNEDVHLDYRMRNTPAGWRMIDVYLGGTISELALRRAEYTAVLDRDGFDSLVSALERKVSEGPPDAPASSDSRFKK